MESNEENQEITEEQTVETEQFKEVVRRKRKKSNYTQDIERSTRSVGSSYASPPWNFSWVVAGEICGSAWPESSANIEFLKNEGVGYIISLSEERKPHRSAHQHMKCYVIPVVEFEDPSMEQIAQFMNICEEARREEKGVCVHCRMGRGRTGVMLACYLVKFHSQHPCSAVTNVRLMRPGSVETREQERAIKNYWDYLAWGKLAY